MASYRKSTGALFATHDDKREVKVCPYCGKDNYLCEIKKVNYEKLL